MNHTFESFRREETIALEELYGINKLIKQPPLSDPEWEQYRIGFLEGRAFEITTKLAEHPEWWDRTCHCTSCREYGN